MAYGIDAYVSMFEATGVPFYLDKALQLVQNMISNAAPSRLLGPRSFRDSYLGWISRAPSAAGQEVPLYESYCWRYVCRLLTALRHNRTVYASDHYRSQYDTILEFTEKHVFDKWYSRGVSKYMYRENTNMTSHWAYVALHLQLHTSGTRQVRCEAVHANIALSGLPNYRGSSLKQQLQISRTYPGAYDWSAVWGASKGSAQDVAHSNAEVAYIVEGRDHSTIWTDLDIQKLSRTLTDVLMPRRPKYIDGTGEGTGWIADGFVKLGRYSAGVQRALESYQPQGQGQFVAAMAVNSRRLGWV